jgi:hypothetical protein
VAAKNSLIDPQTHAPASDSDLRAAIGDKTAVIVGMVIGNGEPYAARGWAVRLPYSDRPRCRVVIGTDEVAALDRREGRKMLSVTITNVRNLASVQFKGPSTDPEPATPDDLEAVRSYCEHFFTEVEATDGTPRALLHRMLPPGFVVCEMDVEVVFDQTPGPRAGTPLGATA